jgi:hypothetical protein
MRSLLIVDVLGVSPPQLLKELASMGGPTILMWEFFKVERVVAVLVAADNMPTLLKAPTLLACDYDSSKLKLC